MSLAGNLPLLKKKVVAFRNKQIDFRLRQKVFKMKVTQIIDVHFQLAICKAFPGAYKIITLKRAG